MPIIVEMSESSSSTTLIRRSQVTFSFRRLSFPFIFCNLFSYETVKKGDRIAQLILEKIYTPDVIEVDDLDTTERGEGGYGSTNKKAKICTEDVVAQDVKTCL